MIFGGEESFFEIFQLLGALKSTENELMKKIHILKNSRNFKFKCKEIYPRHYQKNLRHFYQIFHFSHIFFLNLKENEQQLIGARSRTLE